MPKPTTLDHKPKMPVTFVEDNDDEDDEIIVVPYVKPPPTIITLAESDTESRPAPEDGESSKITKRKRSAKKSGSEHQKKKTKKNLPCDNDNSSDTFGSLSPPLTITDQNSLGAPVVYVIDDSSDNNENVADEKEIINEKKKKKSKRKSAEAGNSKSSFRTDFSKISTRISSPLPIPTPKSESPPSYLQSLGVDLDFVPKKKTKKSIITSHFDVPTFEEVPAFTVNQIRSQQQFQNYQLDDEDKELRSKSNVNRKRKHKSVPKDERLKKFAQQPMVLPTGVFPNHWTPEMTSFYGEEISKLVLSRTRRNQSDDSDNWIAELDDYPAPKRTYYVKCSNCQQWGHGAKKCPEKKKGIICNICGGEGHRQDYCPKALCLNCGSKQGRFHAGCSKCMPRFPIICELCRLKGHRDEQCPDHWRRYHSTTTTTHILNTSKNEQTGRRIDEARYLLKKRSYCANCGSKGHNYFQCKAPLPNNSYVPNKPFIINELTSVECSKVEEREEAHRNSEIEPGCSSNKHVYFQTSSDEPEIAEAQDVPDTTVMWLNKIEHELLLKSYQTMKPATLLFFNKYRENIVKISIEVGKTEIHLNGSSTESKNEARDNLFRLLRKLKAEQSDSESLTQSELCATSIEVES